MIENYKKGIKAFNNDATCRDFKFEEGKIYEIEGELSLCENGFHFCPYIACTLEYYPDLDNNLYAEVEALGEIIYEEPTKLKAATSKIKIIRFMDKEEILSMFDKKQNTGNSNTGYSNTGDWNTGYSNTGYRNTGNRNTGYKNTGNRNTGSWNTGDWNTGDWNTGDSNTGNSNTGYINTGNSNTGNRNTGDWNTGDSNTGNRNTGDWNTGNRNTGSWNTGNRNTGDWNTGSWNTGSWNTGNSNTGSWNTGNRNTGFFNTDTPQTVRVFNKEVNKDIWEKCDKPRFIYFKLEPEISYKENFINSYKKADLEDRLKIFNLPNFDKDFFFEISGIDVTELEEYL